MKQIIGVVLLTAILGGSGLVARVPKKASHKSLNAQKSKDSPEFFEGVVTYPGATKVPVAAKQAILIDFNSGKVLLEKNADERMVPSSMTKMMTTYVMEEEILKGKISNETEFLVSKKAWSTQGSKMFIHVGDKVKVADLHRGIAIQSGNDASITVAEGIMGTEEGFAIEMTRVAKELGMNNTNFKNASGLPEEGHYSTARDLSKLAQAIIKNHSKFYGVNKEKEFTYAGIKQGNRNPLLSDNTGCDGIKTGHTDAGGYGVTVSCLDGDQRYILVINGLPSVQARADEARSLIGWAKGNFIGKAVIKKGEVVDKAAKVSLGVKDTVPLVAAKDAYMLMLRTEQNQLKRTHTISGNLAAPIQQGQRAGVFIATVGDSRAEVELVAAESVEKLGLIKRALKYIGII